MHTAIAALLRHKNLLFTFILLLAGSCTLMADPCDPIVDPSCDPSITLQSTLSTTPDFSISANTTVNMANSTYVFKNTSGFLITNIEFSESFSNASGSSLNCTDSLTSVFASCTPTYSGSTKVFPDWT